MVNVRGHLERLNLNIDSPLMSMQQVRTLIDDANDPRTYALGVIKDLTGEERTYQDDLDARLIAMGVVERAVKANCTIADPVQLLLDMEKHIEGLRQAPATSWTFVRAEFKKQAEHDLLSNVDGVDVQVSVKDNGKIKKGGKQVLAAELYKKHVLEGKPALTNQEFIALLVKTLDMTKSGGTTYAWNMKKKLGEPNEGLKMSPKGKKAKNK